MKIAITGANGFVGSCLLRHFDSLGHSVVALIRSTSTHNLDPVFEVRRVDYHNVDNLRQCLHDVDVLIHNAGITKALTFADLYDGNVQLTRLILKAVSKVERIRQFILISSQAASKPSTPDMPVTEDLISKPVTWYGRSKQLAEKLVQDNCTIPYTIIRPCSIYGPGDKDFLQLAKLAKRGFIIQIGNKVRHLNMIHVNELASLIELTLLNANAYGEVFFATDGEIYTQNQIASLMAEALGSKAKKITIPDRMAGLIFDICELWSILTHKPFVLNKQKKMEVFAEGWICSIDKARRKLSFNPEPNIRKRIKETIQWYEEFTWL